MKSQYDSKEELLGYNGLPRYREPTHPGVIIKEEFLPGLIKSVNKKEIELDEQDVINNINTWFSNFSLILDGVLAITAEDALYLSELFGVSATFWLNLQRDFDLAQAIKNVNLEHLKLFRNK